LGRREGMGRGRWEAPFRRGSHAREGLAGGGAVKASHPLNSPRADSDGRHNHQVRQSKDRRGSRYNRQV
jgi:hypothetical protein